MNDTHITKDHISLSPERNQALIIALEHVRLAYMRVVIAERLLMQPQIVCYDADEPDDLTVAYEAVDQALSCLKISYEEIEHVRFLP